MSGRAWSVLVAALLVVGAAAGLHAGGPLSPPSAPATSGGGVTVGNAVSGGTASRLLFNDASGLVSTATPALGAGLTLTGALSAASVAATGAATVGTTLGVTGATTLSSTLRVDGAVSNGGSGTCSGYSAGAVCVNDTALVLSPASNGSTDIYMHTAAGTGGGHYQRLSFVGVSTINASIRYSGSGGSNPADIRSTLAVSTASATEPVVVGNGAALSNTQMGLSVRESIGGGTSLPLFEVDGVGGLRMRPNTSAHGATCNSAAEGTLYYRAIAASNKSGTCICAQTSSGVYAWKMQSTFGSSALTDGDC